mmetsp:Transcript_35323/g.85675  ORF Transcript_35323/g.85675 Transcript_35323/m.85675 type:complete len:423 (-) Transcript_35323:753-2021(-)
MLYFTRRCPSSIALEKVVEGCSKRCVKSKAIHTVPWDIRVSHAHCLPIQRLSHYSQHNPKIDNFGITLRTLSSISNPDDGSDDIFSFAGSKIEVTKISCSDDPAKWLKETCMSDQFPGTKESTVDKLPPGQWMNTHNATHWIPRIMKAMWNKRSTGSDVLEAEFFGKLTFREQSLLLACLKKSEADDRYVCDFTELCEAVYQLEDATALEIRAAQILKKTIVFQSHVSPEKDGDVHHAWPICALGSKRDPRNYKVVSKKAHLLCHIALASLFPSIHGFNYAVAMMLGLDFNKMTEEQGFLWLEREELVDAAAAARARASQRQWDDSIDQLLAFKEEHGHCRVPVSFPGLGRWVHRQRVLFRKGKLNEDRKQQLEAIGFVWNPLDEQWDDWIDQLLAFKEEQGHCLVPRSFPGLGMWVKKYPK